ncbi:hypothetical protein ACFLTC_03635 [Chloroflexota bacterium]
MLDVLVSALTDPKLWIIVLVWGAIMMLERGMVFYASQQKGMAALNSLPGMTPERMESVASMFDRLGSGVLLFASIPMFGQLLTAIAGAGKASRATFVVFVAVSYLVRNWLIVILSEQIVNLFL